MVNPSQHSASKITMGKFSVSYQLNKTKNYPALWSEMARLRAHKAMNDYYLLEVGFVDAEHLRAHLSQFVDNDDMLFVCVLDRRPASYRCYQGTNDWLDSHFY
jgi:hypothetical protein